MSVDGYIYAYPRQICGYEYGYGWEISYQRQAWRSDLPRMYSRCCLSLVSYDRLLVEKIIHKYTVFYMNS